MTDRFGNILVVTAPDVLEPDVLRAAFELADTHGARLTVLDVVEPPPRWAPVRRRRTDVHTVIADRSELLRGLVADLGASAHIEVVVGQLHVEAIERASEHDHDLVIIGSGPAATSDLPVIPNRVTQLLRNCPVPVWVMRAARSHRPRVLALVDPNADDPARDELNGRVLELAAALARDGEGELHVGHALERASEHAPDPPPGTLVQGDPAGDGSSSSPRGLPDERLGAMLRCHGIAESAVHLVTGHAGEALPALAADIDAGVVVMGTVARTGISGLIIGNSAETMLSSATCSVLAVKPGDRVAAVAPAAEANAERASAPRSSNRWA